MSHDHVILCGGLRAPEKEANIVVPLNLSGNKRNITLKITDISEKLVANIPPILVDLLEIATYVYCADQAVTRGSGSAINYGAKWRRRLRFHIPVREPDIWSDPRVLTLLQNTLNFLSDDEYEFRFYRLAKPPNMIQYLDFGADNVPGFDADEVALFSGGLDSCAGAVQDAVVQKRSIVLVNHRSSSKMASRSQNLLQDIKALSSKRPFYVPIWITKDKTLSKEYTQRTRSFLYSSLAAVVARIFGLSRIRFYENGIVSINLPISPQVVGGRASRTTHPGVLNGLSDLFSLLFDRPFTVENPFLWMTKAQVVDSICHAGCGELIKNTVSCTHVWAVTTLKTHCGICSQCIDRRFATLSAGCSDAEDPEEMYKVDLLRDARQPGDDRTMLESYVCMAKSVKNMSETAFFSQFGEAHRVTQQIRGMKAHEAASKILEIYKRHAKEVCGVISKGIKLYADDIRDGNLPTSSLLIMALPGKYTQQHAQVSGNKRFLSMDTESKDPDIGTPQWRTQTARNAANARHRQPGGSHDKRQRIRDIWATGKYRSRDRCAEEECAALNMSYSAARKALRNTPNP